MGRKKVTNTTSESVSVEIKNSNSKPKDIKPKIKPSELSEESKSSPAPKKQKVEENELLSKTTKKDKASNDAILKRITKIEKTLEKVSKQLESLLKTQKTNKKEKKPKEINNTVGESDSKKNITPKINKRESPNAKKEDTNISFGFKVFFKKTDDEKSIKEKSQKIEAYMNTYLGSQAFLKKYGLSNETNDTVKKGTKNTLPVQLDIILSEENKECVLRFSFDPTKNTGTKISEKTIGSIVESVQDKLLHAEESGWCEGVVYDIGG